MGKVTSFSLAGIQCWFWSLDHRPPHFHAKKDGQWHVSVYFLRLTDQMIERRPGPRGVLIAKDRNALCDMAKQHREELLAEWERKVSSR